MKNYSKVKKLIGKVTKLAREFSQNVFVSQHCNILKQLACVMSSRLASMLYADRKHHQPSYCEKN
jgi:hypothetical protein